MPSPSSLATLLPLLAVFAASVSACGGPADPDGADDPIPVTATLDLDGLVLLRVTGSSMSSVAGPAGLELLDPNTGKRSARLEVATSNSLRWSTIDPFGVWSAGDPFVVSPDGTRVAYFAPEPGAHHLVVARMELGADGVPRFTPSVEVDLLAFGPLSWPASADLVVVGGALVDPETGAVLMCPDGMGDDDPDSAVRVFPDGSICSTPQTGGRRYAYRDRAGWVLNEWGGSSDGVPITADAQVHGAGLHLPSGAMRAISMSNAVAEVFAGFAARDGSLAHYQAGADGAYITDLGAGPQVRSQALPLVDYPRLDLLGSVAAGAYQLGALAPGATKLEAAPGLDKGLLHDGEGRHFGPAMVTGDGRVVFAVLSHIIESDPLLNLPRETPIASAFQEVRPDGTTRAFRSSGVLSAKQKSKAGAFARIAVPGSDFARETMAALALELTHGDWLYPSYGLNESSTSPSYVGYLEGEPILLEGVGAATADGARFLASHAPTQDAPGTFCVSEVARKPNTRCMTMEGAPTAIDLVGDRGEGPPIVRVISRDSAWPGAPVVIYGARFGATPGSVAVGGVEVPASAITSWSDHRVAFTMDASLPSLGELRVTTAAGASRGRAFWLGKTARIPSPWDDIPSAPIPVGQGFNDVPAKLLPPELKVSNASHGVTIDPDVRGPDDTVVVLALQSDEGHHTIGGWSRMLRFGMENRLADEVHWQLVKLDVTVGSPFFDFDAGFDRIAGEYIQHDAGLRPHFDDGAIWADRVLNAPLVTSQTPSLLPHFWRAPLGATATSWVINWPVDALGIGTARVDHMLGWTTDSHGIWGVPEMASGVGKGFQRATGVAAIGDDVLVVGGANDGSSHAAFYLSHDGGATWSGPTVIADTETGFVEPVAIHDDAGDYFLTFEAGWIASGWAGGAPRGVHRIDRDGTFTPDVVPAPPSVESAAWYKSGYHHPFDVVQSGSRLLVYAPASSTLVTVDLAAPSPGWTTLPTADAAHKVRNIFHDAKRDELVILMKDGSALRATDLSGWSDFAPYDFGFDAPATRVVPFALMRAPDGRWLVNASLYAGDSDKASPWGKMGWLISPPPKGP